MPDTTTTEVDTTMQGELARRADSAHRSRADRVSSTLGYYSPELAAATTLGSLGAVLWHPAVAAVAAAGFTARIVAARLAHIRAHRARLIRQAHELAAADPAATHTGEHDSPQPESGEVAG